MRELPILFSSPMIAAVIGGTKTQTRRIVKGLPDNASDQLVQIMVSGHHGEHGHVNCPFGKPGDILWVRENWRPLGYSLDDGQAEFGVIFTADNSKAHFPVDYDGIDKVDRMIVKECDRRGVGINEDGSFTDKITFSGRPSIHLPKWLSRIWLKVKSVRVERLHAISEYDARSEGITKVDAHCGFDRYKCYDKKETTFYSANQKGFLNPAASFMSLWSSINGRESLESNPWVWVVEFEVLSTTGKPEISN